MWIQCLMEIKSTPQYRSWFSSLKDETIKARINIRLKRLSDGNPGNHRVLSGGVEELKLTFGPGYRVYYTTHNGELIILLVGGDKSSQQDDIKQAIELVKQLKELS